MIAKIQCPYHSFGKVWRVSVLIESMLTKRSWVDPKPDWYEQLPETVRELLDEVYSGMIHGLRSLPAMGGTGGD